MVGVFELVPTTVLLSICIQSVIRSKFRIEHFHRLCYAVMSEKNIKQAIIAAIRAIPAGTATSYGAVAQVAGFPGRARLVARILSDGDTPGLPWHRVLRSSGQIAFPPDSPAYVEQVQRLRAEGVVVTGGRVKLRKAELDLDALLWSRP